MDSPALTPDATRTTKKSAHASIGKIARLPADIRQELNQRLLNGKTGPEILPWLNALPAVKEVLTAHFDAVPIGPRNLSLWRKNSYPLWLAEQKKLSDMQNLGQYATGMAEAAGGSISRGAAAVASGRILQFLDKNPGADTDPEDLVKFGTVAARLLRGEQNSVRLKIAHERLRQRDQQLRLIRDRDQRDTVAVMQRVLNDAQSKAIQEAPISNAEKIELLGRRHFGHLWEPRSIPTEESSSSSCSSSK